LQKVGLNSFYSFLENKDVNNLAVAFGARVWQEQRKAGINKVFIYTMHQSDTMPHTGCYKKLIGFDRSLTPSATATAVTAYCIDGLTPQKTDNFKGVVQSLFSNGRRHAWSAFKDSGSNGYGCIDLERLPEGFDVIDAMGNDPRKDGVTNFALGSIPLFVVGEGGSISEFYAKCTGALLSSKKQ